MRCKSKANLQRAKHESRPRARMACQLLPCRAAASHPQANGNIIPQSCTMGKCTIVTLGTSEHRYFEFGLALGTCIEFSNGKLPPIVEEHPFASSTLSKLGSYAS